MPLIDVECSAGHIREVMRPLAMHPATPPCPDCGADTKQVMLPRAVAWSCDPVVVYRTPDGSFRFPGDVTTKVTKTYDTLGYERIELRSAADVRRFETQMNKRELSRANRKVEAMQAAREARESATRSELRRLMPQMSTFGQQLAREAMRRNDAKPRERARDVNFHVDAFSNYRGNREESRDPQGRRRRD